MDVEDARRLALELPEAVEQDHHGRPSFRVAKKIFATLPGDGQLNVMLSAEETELAVQADPAAFEELRWGQQLAGVRVDLATADPGRVADLLRWAWLRRAPRRLARDVAPDR